MTPIGHAIRFVARGIYKHILTRLGKALEAGGILLYDYILTPIGKGLKFLFHTLPILFYLYVRSKFTGRLKRFVIKVCKNVYRDYLTPVGQVITAGASWLFIILPTQFRDHVLVPIKNQIVQGGVFLKDKVITPIGEGAVWLGHAIQDGAIAIKDAAYEGAVVIKRVVGPLFGGRANRANEEVQEEEYRKVA